MDTDINRNVVNQLLLLLLLVAMKKRRKKKKIITAMMIKLAMYQLIAFSMQCVDVFLCYMFCMDRHGMLMLMLGEKRDS
jgi:hypothetical protein